ncbi:MAG: hypothetical protein M3041_18435 [Acidobacteriota bacterium]|nr:hypothetical protein [Acidobacteriota bacterium]
MDCAILSLTIWLAGADIDSLAAGLLKRTGAEDDFEQAAFVVRHADGSLSVIDWPSGHLFRKATWSGPVPPGTIAIIHTHPLRMPLPSQIDRVEATRTGLTIYAVTRLQLCSADPHNRIACRSTKSRAELRGIPPAADDWMSPVSQMNPE